MEVNKECKMKICDFCKTDGRYHVKGNPNVKNAYRLLQFDARN